MILSLLSSSPLHGQLNPDMIEAAKKEGTVVLYAALPVNTTKKIGDLFEKRYGIRVNHWRGSATGIVNRVLNEARANNSLFDVVIGNRGVINAIKEKGLLTRFKPPAAASFPAKFRDPEHLSTTWRVLPVGINYNTKLLKADEAPKNWSDLQAPKWKKNFALANPAIHTTTLQFVVSLHKLLGGNWLEVVKGWAKQNPRLGRSMSPAVRTLISGEVPVAIAYIKSKFQYSGAPIDYVRMEKYLASVSALSVGKDSPHPNAARLFINFFLEPEPLKIFAEEDGEFTIHPAVKVRFEDVTSDQIILMDVPMTQEIETWQKKFSDIFGT
ncbi:MAG: ABC transporter substrate-binding protein [Candidatus Binatia bacterium]